MNTVKEFSLSLTIFRPEHAFFRLESDAALCHHLDTAKEFPMLRNGLSYRQAATNASRVACAAYDDAIACGADVDAASALAAVVYEKEMQWYESVPEVR